MSVRMEASREGRAASHFFNSDSYWALHCPCTRLQTMSLICTQEHTSKVKTLCLAFLVLSWPYYNIIFLAVRNSKKMVLYFHSLPTGNKTAWFYKGQTVCISFFFLNLTSIQFFCLSYSLPLRRGEMSSLSSGRRLSITRLDRIYRKTAAADKPSPQRFWCYINLGQRTRFHYSFQNKFILHTCGLELYAFGNMGQKPAIIHKLF